MAMLASELKSQAALLGFSRIGFIPAQPARRLSSYKQWIDEGLHGEMAYMARSDRVVRREDPAIILPGVQTIICVGLDYYTNEVPAAIAEDPSRGRISNYAWGVDYHDLMTPRLEQLAAWLRAQGPLTKTRVYVDTGAILERDHAELAGLGFTGKNSMLIAPRTGSWQFLGEILTTIAITDEAQRPPMPSCGSCERCIDACPTNAFQAPYVLDARRCISYLTIELKGWIPGKLRPLLGNWVYGCDICQDVCPFNRFSTPTGELRFQAKNWDRAAPPLVDLLSLSQEAFNQRFSSSPIKRIKRRRLVRNAAVAAGNWGSQEAVPHLVPLLDDDEPLVRGHVAWALRRIGGSAARQALQEALGREQDKRVRLELKGKAYQ
ncbi:MAG: tRNA epoxyqueuosine(34) reductase QueG [Candidatus Promineifilaceae bacterium]|nr:tRNA epoxyqueuosine(34) reductase QueG [Candidatus Promineifilaceae bacterium]